MADKRETEKYRALYYPYIEVKDESWLLSAALFWDEVSTITPNTENPYKLSVSKELADEGVLIPFRARDNRNEVARISEQISGLLGNPAFLSVFGEGNWAVQQARRHPVFPDKIESNLRHELVRKGAAARRDDGLFEIEEGLAAAYFLLLAVEVAAQNSCSLVTDISGAYRASEAIRFQDSIVHDEFMGFRGYRNRRETIGVEYVDACVSEMILTWFRIEAGTETKQIIRFRKKRRDELERMRNAVFRVNSGILTDDDLSYDNLRKRAKDYVHNEIRPAFDDLKKILREERVKFLPGALQAALYAEAPGSLIAAAGNTWALVAAPLCGITIKGIRFLLERQETLRNSPWSYLYQAEKSFGTAV